MRLSVRITTWAFSFVLVCISTAGHASQVSNNALGYSLTMPDDWEAIPQPAIDKTLQAVVSNPGGSAIHYCDGYQLVSHAKDFEYPYILIQDTSYPGGRQITSISEDELKNTVAEMTGVKIGDIQKPLSTPVASLLTNYQTPTATYSTQPPGFQMDFVLSVAGVGQVRGRSVGLIGKDRIIAINCYATADIWDKYKDEFQQIATGFQLNPEQRIVLGADSGLRHFDWSKVGTNAAVGAVVGMIGGLFVWLSKKRQSKPGN